MNRTRMERNRFLRTALIILATATFAVAQRQSCPVSITSLQSSSSFKAAMAAALTGGDKSTTYLVIKYQNDTAKTISVVRFMVVYLNSLHEPLPPKELVTPTHNVKPHKGYSVFEGDEYITNGEKLQTSGWVAKVAFTDGTTWTDDGSKSCKEPENTPPKN
jgi:hypothetical protein